MNERNQMPDNDNRQRIKTEMERLRTLSPDYLDALLVSAMDQAEADFTGRIMADLYLGELKINSLAKSEDAANRGFFRFAAEEGIETAMAHFPREAAMELVQRAVDFAALKVEAAKAAPEQTKGGDDTDTAK